MYPKTFFYLAMNSAIHKRRRQEDKRRRKEDRRREKGVVSEATVGKQNKRRLKEDQRRLKEDGPRGQQPRNISQSQRWKTLSPHEWQTADLDGLPIYLEHCGPPIGKIHSATFPDGSRKDVAAMDWKGNSSLNHLSASTGVTTTVAGPLSVATLDTGAGMSRASSYRLHLSPWRTIDRWVDE
jgi:hypothetical protein